MSAFPSAIFCELNSCISALLTHLLSKKKKISFMYESYMSIPIIWMLRLFAPRVLNSKSPVVSLYACFRTRMMLYPFTCFIPVTAAQYFINFGGGACNMVWFFPSSTCYMLFLVILCLIIVRVSKTALCSLTYMQSQ